jgi:predicted metal-dependent hydrolase
MRISVSRESKVVVTLPWGLNQSSAIRFVLSKQDWIIKSLEYFKNFKCRILPKSGKREYLKYKNLALGLAQKKVIQWNKIYGFAYNRIGIKNQKTRWGSCSKKGNLNFNYKIAHLPEYLVDYLVVHELCHLREFNHSKKFWALVGQAVPNYKKCRRELRGSVM